MIKFLIPAYLNLIAKACHVKAEFLHIEPGSCFGVVYPNIVVNPAAIAYSVGSPVCDVGQTQIITPAIGAVGVVNTGAVGVVASGGCGSAGAFIAAGGCGGAVGIVAPGGCCGDDAIILCQTESECCE